jgi:LysR family glycine cleavage system transcriptional activator
MIDMHRVPPLGAVRAFEAAARHGNFTRAAEELGTTQAAVSYQIKVLEDRVGAPLFARKGRGVELTELGLRIAPEVTAAFEKLDNAFDAARSEQENVLTISAPATFATNWLSARIGDFQLARPDLAVRLRVTDTITDFAGGEVDVAIRGTVGPWPGLASHFLMRMPFTPFASPALLSLYPPVRTVDDLLALPRLSPDDGWWRLWLAATIPGGAAVDIPPSVQFESQVLQGYSAIAGHGVAVLSPPMWLAAIATGQLVQPLPHVAMYRNSFWLVYPEAKRRMRKVGAFRAWLLAEVAASLGDDPYHALVPPSPAEIAVSEER